MVVCIVDVHGGVYTQDTRRMRTFNTYATHTHARMHAHTRAQNALTNTWKTQAEARRSCEHVQEKLKAAMQNTTRLEHYITSLHRDSSSRVDTVEAVCRVSALVSERSQLRASVAALNATLQVYQQDVKRLKEDANEFSKGACRK